MGKFRGSGGGGVGGGRGDDDGEGDCIGVMMRGEGLKEKLEKKGVCLQLPS